MEYNNQVHLYQCVAVQVHRHYIQVTNSIKANKSIAKKHFLILKFYTLGRNGNRIKQSFLRT